MIGIIGAMDEEVAALKEKMEVEKVTDRASMQFVEGKLEGKEVTVVRSGHNAVLHNLCLPSNRGAPQLRSALF